mgnify:CR=1 FL=1
MPDFLPDRLEAGTHNVPGIAGLLAGVRYVQQRGPENILLRERRLAQLVSEGLRRLPGVTVYANGDLHSQAGVVSFTSRDLGAEEIAAALGEKDIAVRGSTARRWPMRQWAPWIPAPCGSVSPTTTRPGRWRDSWMPWRRS